MSQIQQTFQLTFSLTECKCTSFAIIGDEKAIPDDKYQFVTNLGLDISETDKTIAVLTNCNLLDIRTNKEVAKLDSIFKFKIANLNELLIKNAMGTALPDKVITTLFSIALSTLRGMFAIKLENSIYSNAILPIIDVAQFLPKQNSSIG